MKDVMPVGGNEWDEVLDCCHSLPHEDKTKTPCSIKVSRPAIFFPCSRDRHAAQKSRTDIERMGVADRLKDLNKSLKGFVVAATSI
jgi:hypothetical protein